MKKRHSDPKVNCLYTEKYQKGKKRNGKKMLLKNGNKSFSLFAKG